MFLPLTLLLLTACVIGVLMGLHMLIWAGVTIITWSTEVVEWVRYRRHIHQYTVMPADSSSIWLSSEAARRTVRLHTVETPLMRVIGSLLTLPAAAMLMLGSGWATFWYAWAASCDIGLLFGAMFGGAA